MVYTTTFLTAVLNDTLAFLETDITHAAVGTSSTTPTAADTSLTAQVFNDTIDEIDDSLTDRRSHTLMIGSGEANGNTIRECGFKSGSNLRSHDLLNAITKTSDIQLFVTLTTIVTVEEI